jgi:hypothetical protein
LDGRNQDTENLVYFADEIKSQVPFNSCVKSALNSTLENKLTYLARTRLASVSTGMIMSSNRALSVNCDCQRQILLQAEGKKFTGLNWNDLRKKRLSLNGCDMKVAFDLAESEVAIKHRRYFTSSSNRYKNTRNASPIVYLPRLLISPLLNKGN